MISTSIKGNKCGDAEEREGTDILKAIKKPIPAEKHRLKEELIDKLTASPSPDESEGKFNQSNTVSSSFMGTIKEIKNNTAIVNAKLSGGEMDIFVVFP